MTRLQCLDAAMFSQVRNAGLSGLPLRWEQWPFANLTPLCPQDFCEFAFTLPQLAGILSSYPSLVDLLLISSPPYEGPRGIAPHSPVILPSLRSFRFEHLFEVTETLSMMRSARTPNLEQPIVLRWWSHDYSEAISLISSASTGYPSITRLASLQCRSVYEGIFESLADLTELTVYSIEDGRRGSPMSRRSKVHSADSDPLPTLPV